jgi:hypothetical protein
MCINGLRLPPGVNVRIFLHAEPDIDTITCTRELDAPEIHTGRINGLKLRLPPGANVRISLHAEPDIDTITCTRELDAPKIYARRIHADPPQVLARGHIGRRRRGGRHGRSPPEFKSGPDVVIVARDHLGPDRRCGSNAIQIIDMFFKTMLNTILINIKKKKKKNRRRD